MKKSDVKGDLINYLLEWLEEAGYDVGTIRAAMENVNMETARTLLQKFVKECEGKFPHPPEMVRHRGEGMRDTNRTCMNNRTPFIQ